MADLAIGITACISFWRDLSFKAAAVCTASIFLLGDAIGHVREMVVAGNFAPGLTVLHGRHLSCARYNAAYYRNTRSECRLVEFGLKAKGK
jgi:hypothetical protein